MRTELITTGTELLLGTTLNTHVRFLADTLFPFGLRFQRQTAVPDGPAIADVLRESLGRSDLILITGGLGPTSDDMTREIVAEELGLPLEYHPKTGERIREFYRQRGREYDASGHRQAMVPAGARVLTNLHGTAPGFYIPGRADRPRLFLLPGPPRELYPMVEHQVIPILESLASGGAGDKCRVWGFFGIGESELGTHLEPGIEEIGGLEIGFCAKPAHVELRCIGALEKLEAVDRVVKATYPEHHFASRGEGMEEVVVRLLIGAGKWVSAAESCTGGLIAHRLTNVPGASEVFGRSWITYANEAKSELLGVDSELIRSHGVVSEAVVKAMAEGCLNRAGADYALAVSGIAGPGGGSREKPVGTVWIALAGRETRSFAAKCFFPADRETFKLRASQKALDLLRRALSGLPPE